LSRRSAVKGIGAAAAGIAALGAAGAASQVDDDGGPTLGDAVADFFQDHYKKMSPSEVEATVERLERKYKAEYGIEIEVGTTPPIPGVIFGYAINISKCKGYRDCVRACMEENNLSSDAELQYIRVLELSKGTLDLESSDHYFDPEEVPQEGKVYLPVQCHQCDNPPCVAACPIEATWMEPDGITVIDYDWCIGCRYCMTACPYWARHFNWKEPNLVAEEINPVTDYLSNRPRSKGVTEKCTFCLQRTRKGRLPACHEACPTGARVFGNLLDPHSEIRQVLETKTVFRLKEDLNTEPKFWYYTD
jgi:molybdopterin-containing oxidoreductase family iron-sulfur binding subunit